MITAISSRLILPCSLSGESGVGSLRCVKRPFAVMQVKIDHHEHHQHDAADEQRLLPEMFCGPEELDALQEADEQRRIAERRQRAADIGDQKDKEHHDMRVVSPVVVGPDQRPDQDHRRARGATMLAITAPTASSTVLVKTLSCKLPSR